MLPLCIAEFDFVGGKGWKSFLSCLIDFVVCYFDNIKTLTKNNNYFDCLF